MLLCSDALFLVQPRMWRIRGSTGRAASVLMRLVDEGLVKRVPSTRPGYICRAARRPWGGGLHKPRTYRIYGIHVRPARSILSNALNFRCSAIAAFVRSP